jgi:hypothetical protein
MYFQFTKLKEALCWSMPQTLHPFGGLPELVIGKTVLFRVIKCPILRLR